MYISCKDQQRGTCAGPAHPLLNLQSKTTENGHQTPSPLAISYYLLDPRPLENIFDPRMHLFHCILRSI